MCSGLVINDHFIRQTATEARISAKLLKQHNGLHLDPIMMKRFESLEKNAYAIIVVQGFPITDDRWHIEKAVASGSNLFGPECVSRLQSGYNAEWSQGVNLPKCKSSSFCGNGL